MSGERWRTGGTPALPVEHLAQRVRGNFVGDCGNEGNKQEYEDDRLTQPGEGDLNRSFPPFGTLLSAGLVGPRRSRVTSGAAAGTCKNVGRGRSAELRL